MLYLPKCRMLAVPASSRWLIIFLVYCLTVGAGPLFARGADDLDHVTIEGRVQDANGAVVVGAQVTATNQATGLTRQTLTDEAGRFRLGALPPGVYSIQAAAKDFTLHQFRDQTAVAGQVIRLEFILQPQGITAEIKVEAGAAPLIDAEKTVVGDTFNTNEIEQLPVSGRNILDLIFLLAGVAEEPLSVRDLDPGKETTFRPTPEEAGNFSLNGAPAFSNNLTIDGLDNNDDRSARERIRLTADTVAEVQVITNQFSAEYGRASGGRVNLTTRSGSNEYHGRFHGRFSDESFNANSSTRKARGLKRPLAQDRSFTGTLGGPLKRDKLFFFASYDRQATNETAFIDTFLPLEPHPLFPLPAPNLAEQRLDTSGVPVGRYFVEVPTPGRRNLALGRIDYYLTNQHNLTTRFDYLAGRDLRSFAGGNRLLENAVNRGRDSHSVGLSDNYVFSDRWVNQLRFQFSRLLPRSVPLNQDPTVRLSIRTPENDRTVTDNVIAGAFAPTALDFSNFRPSTSDRTEQRFQLQEVLAYSHKHRTLKLGFDYQYLTSAFTNLDRELGIFTFSSAAAFFAATPTRFQQRSATTSKLRNQIIGLFAQSDWKVRRNLKLSLGVRYDSETILADRNNFSPRIAVAWNPRGRSQTLVRAGFGIFYNRALLRTLDDFFIQTNARVADSNLRPEILDVIEFPRQRLTPAQLNQFGVPENFLRLVGPDLIMPYTEQANLGLERALRRNLALEFNYNFTRAVHLWRETNINAPVVPAGFRNLTEYLLSRDFDNRPDASGRRPISASAADVVRFDLTGNSATTNQFGLRLLNLGLNTATSAHITQALAAVRALRPNPALNQVEQLEATGNSFYHGGSLSLRHRFARGMTFRVAYTLAKLIDEGTTNTASAMIQTNRRADRSLSLQDQRHQVVFSGIFTLPWLKLELAPVVSLGSGRPFNLGNGSGLDRNLNDIDNDRPVVLAPLPERLRWRRPGEVVATDIFAALGLATIGSDGNLSRNAGIGPPTRAINLRVARTIRWRERLRLRPQLDAFNLFNNTIYSFGSEFINRSDSAPLTPRRARQPRQVQVSLRLDF